jgi:hypothetical protein
VNTTISVLEGLPLYELHRRDKLREVRAAQRRGREFLLAHRLYRSHRTGEIIKPVFTRLAFPPRWHYDVLRALDYFQAVNAPRDPRLADAIGMVKGKRDADGRWPLEHVYHGKTYFAMERLGAPRAAGIRCARCVYSSGGSRRKGCVSCPSSWSADPTGTPAFQNS